jgi:NADH-quinone oxidoreductase subunit B
VGVTAVTIGRDPADAGFGSNAVGEPMRFVLNWDREYAVWLFNFGLACCAVEFVSASMSHPDLIAAAARAPSAGPAHVDLVVVSGTVTDKMAPAIKRVFDALPDPKYVISFGSCANCGGPYWDSYCVTKGVDQLIPVDVYVPGCPPRPEALLDGIRLLQQTITAAGG